MFGPIDMPSNDELWGTFAVDDHTRDRAFVAEAVLFDRLVIPQPPEGDEEQYRDWVNAGWRPELLKPTIDTLAEFAIPVPWNRDLRSQWGAEYARLSPAERAAKRLDLGLDATSDAKNIKNMPPDQPAKHVTRKVLAKKIKDPLSEQEDEALYRRIKALDIDPTAEIETVVGYGSYTKFKEEVPVDEKQAPVAPGQDAAFLFRWEFLVPADSDLTDLELLRRAVKLSRKSEFRDSRREFHDWRRKLIDKKVSIEAARAEMDRCLAVYNSIVAEADFRSRVSTALQVLTATAAAADLLHQGLGMAGSVVFGVAALLWDKLVPEPQVGSRERIAALVHDSREAFGWRKH